MSPKPRRVKNVARVYTPPPRKPQLRYRPPQHRLIAGALVVAGVGIVVLNIVTEYTETRLLPGGHSPLYLVLGIVVAASSTWWVGWFDRPR